MQPTELSNQANTLRILADLTDRAVAAGATLIPRWYTPLPEIIDGTVSSDDDTAVRDFDVWMGVLGGSADVRSYTYMRDRDLCRATTLSTTYQGISFRFMAIVPVGVETMSRFAGPVAAAMGVAA